MVHQDCVPFHVENWSQHNNEWWKQAGTTAWELSDHHRNTVSGCYLDSWFHRKIDNCMSWKFTSNECRIKLPGCLIETNAQSRIWMGMWSVNTEPLHTALSWAGSAENLNAETAAFSHLENHISRTQKFLNISEDEKMRILQKTGINALFFFTFTWISVILQMLTKEVLLIKIMSFQ